MFKTLYRCPRTIARHESGPLYESRRQYLEHPPAQGGALHTLRALLALADGAALWLALEPPNELLVGRVVLFGKRSVRRALRSRYHALTGKAGVDLAISQELSLVFGARGASSPRKGPSPPCRNCTATI